MWRCFFFFFISITTEHFKNSVEVWTDSEVDAAKIFSVWNLKLPCLTALMKSICHLNNSQTGINCFLNFVFSAKHFVLFHLKRQMETAVADVCCVS